MANMEEENALFFFFFFFFFSFSLSLCDVRLGGTDLPACQNLFPFISFLYSFQSMSVLSSFGKWEMECMESLTTCY